MKANIKLKSHKELALKLALLENNQRITNGHYYDKNNIKKAVEELVRHNLRYNCDSGVTRLKNDWIERPTNKDDIEQYNSIEEVVQWQFVHQIMNAASRIERGLKAV